MLQFIVAAMAVMQLCSIDGETSEKRRGCYSIFEVFDGLPLPKRFPFHNASDNLLIERLGGWVIVVVRLTTRRGAHGELEKVA